MCASCVGQLLRLVLFWHVSAWSWEPWWCHPSAGAGRMLAIGIPLRDGDRISWGSQLTAWAEARAACQVSCLNAHMAKGCSVTFAAVGAPLRLMIIPSSESVAGARDSPRTRVVPAVAVSTIRDSAVGGCAAPAFCLLQGPWMNARYVLTALGLGLESSALLHAAPTPMTQRMVSPRTWPRWPPSAAQALAPSGWQQVRLGSLPFAQSDGGC